MDLFNEFIPWRHCGDNKENIGKIKKQCLDHPEKFLLTSSCNKKELIEIFYYIKSLKYETKPCYSFIRNKLNELLSNEVNKFKELSKTTSTINQSSLVELFNNKSNFADLFIKETRHSSSGLINPIKQIDDKNFKTQEKFLKKKRNLKIFIVSKDEAKLSEKKQNALEKKAMARGRCNFEITNTCNLNILNQSNKRISNPEELINEYLKSI